MSIVPYVNNRQVVLRHNDSVVLLDPQSKRLDVASQEGLNLAECPYCHQPLRNEDARRQENEDATPSQSGGFVSPEYFRMLQESLPSSATSSTPPSPHRRLVQPVRASLDAPESQSNAANFSTSGLPESHSTGISASAFSQGYFKRFFVEEKELGRGGKGVVLLVTHVLDNVRLGQYACKRVPVGNDHAWLINVLNEVRLLEHLSHNHLVFYKHVWLEDIKISNFGPSVPCVFILQQYCNGGNLHEYIIKSSEDTEASNALKGRARRLSKEYGLRPDVTAGRKLRFEEIRSFFKDITSGLNHLHVNGFIHRDLKPSNCLLHTSAQGLRVLVSDFGEVQIENVVRKSTGATGTVSYCAPEVLRRDPATGALGDFSTKSDIFSLGMILYFLCFAKLPYVNADYVNEENEDLDLLREEIVKWTGLHEERKLRPDLPEQLYTFLRWLLSLDPSGRPSAEEILLAIKTGSGLDTISDARPNKAAHLFDDLSASSRISPVESPRPSTPTRKLSSSIIKSHNRNSPSRIRFPTTFQSSPNDSNSSSPTPSSPLHSTRIGDHHHGDNSADQPEASSPGDSLILRPPFPSPTKIMPDPLKQHTQIRQLPPGSSNPGFTDSPLSQRPLKLILFITKALSFNILCSPMATRSSVLYPMLGLATLDFFLQDRGSQWRYRAASGLLIVVHVAVLLEMKRQEVLCMKPGTVYWE